MQQELIDRYPGDSLAVLIVWAPMMEGDNEDTAREAAEMFSSKRVKQFYDPKRRVGSAYRKDVFPDAFDQAVASLPPDHWLHEIVPYWRERDAAGPEWDIYMFFKPGVTWKESPPAPTRFVRHLGRIVEKDGERLSLMWVDSYTSAPREGSLVETIASKARMMFIH